MASTYTIVDRKRRSNQGGFTLVELLIAAALSAIVFAAIFSAYLFVARNATRLSNTQQQLSQSRTVFYRLAKDVNEATAITLASASRLTLTLSTGTADYEFFSSEAKLKRTFAGGNPEVLISNLSTCSFYYYAKGGSTSQTSVANPNVNVGQLEIRFTTIVGSSNNGTRSTLPFVSSRMVLRSKSVLGQ
jgi:prepilin-type N-terminal cleavage/methylation domain-containing protein